MTVNLPGGLSGMFLADVGKGPGNDNAVPRWRATDIDTTPSNINAWITAADTYDFTLVARLAGNRSAWTNAGPNGTQLYDRAQFRANIEAYRGNANLADAITRRRVQVFTVDEPYIQSFAGTIPKSAQNEMGLFVKDVWNDALTFQRASSQFLSPAPAGGWTGLDYGMSQFDLINIKAGISPTAFWNNERAVLTGMDLGMAPMFNWLDAGDGRLWDYLNTGSSSGRVAGPLSANGSWLASPAEIREITDIAYLFSDAPFFTGYNFVNSGFPKQQYRTYQDRSDFVAAFDYMLNKFATRPTFSGFRTPKGLVTPPPGAGDEVQHIVSIPVTTRVTTVSGTYTDVPGAVLPAASLTAGKQYLVVVTGAFDNSVTSVEASMRVVSGSTALARSEVTWRPAATTSRWPYLFWTVLTAVAGEDISLQFKSGDGIATVGANFCTMFAMNLSDDLVNGTDYAFNSSAASTALTASYQDGAHVTVTPVTNGQDWLILTGAHFLTPTTAASVVSGMHVDDDVSQAEPEVQMEGRNTSNKYALSTARVLSVSGPHDFVERSKNTGGGGPRDGSAVFALRLDRFAAHGYQYTAAELDYVSTAYGTTAATAAVTVPADGDLWLLGSLAMVIGTIGVPSRQRIRLDGADSPSGQTSASYTYLTSNDATDVPPIILQSVPAVVTGVHTLSLDGSHAFPAAGRGARSRLALALTMRLTADPVGTVGFRRSTVDNLGTRSGTRKVR